MYQKFLLAVLLFVSTLFQEDGGFVFRIVQRENTSYRTTTRLVSDSYVDYQGSEEVLNEIRSRGVKFPMHVTQKQTIVLLSTTFSRTSDGGIPFSGRIDSAAKVQYVNGQLHPSTTADPIDTSFRMSGSFRAGDITIDKITRKKIEPALADALKESIAQMMQSVKFPEAPMNVGESFSQKVPMNLPIPGAVPMQVEITTTYMLREIDAKTAYFDLIQESSAASEKNATTLEMASSGKGTMVYNRELGQMTNMETESSMSMRVSIGVLTVLSKGNTKSEMSISVVKNR